MKKIKFLIFFILLLIYFSLYYKFGLFGDKRFFNKIEAIVVLAGEKGRIPFARKIFLQNKNIFLIISGANPNFKKSYLKRILGLQNFSHIIIENSSKNTIENAIQVKGILEKLKIHRILLVTSAIHMPRAFLIFNFILGKKFKIYRKSIPEKFNFFKIFKENVKLLYFLVLYFFKI